MAIAGSGGARQQPGEAKLTGGLPLRRRAGALPAGHGPCSRGRGLTGSARSSAVAIPAL